MKKRNIVFLLLLIVSVLLLLTGFFYIAIKAGVPYQDAYLLPESTINQYNQNMQFGEHCVIISFIVFLASVAFKIIAEIYCRLHITSGE